MILTSTELLTILKRRCMLTNNQLGLSNQDLLDEVTQELQTPMTSLIISAQEGFLVYDELIPVAENTASIRMPSRSAGQTLRHIYWVDSSGSRFELFRIDQEQIEHYSNGSSYPRAFLVQGNKIIFSQPTAVAGNMYVSYIFRPNKLVEESSCQQITAIDFLTNTITVNNAAIFSAGQLYDIINNKSGNEIMAYDLTGTIVGNTIVFNQTLPTSITVGNWVSTAGTSPVPMIPEEFHTFLIELSVARLSKSRGLDIQYKEALNTIASLKKDLLTIMENRVTSKTLTIGGVSPFAYRY